MNWSVLSGDCRELVGGIEPVDAVVCDPPYGLSFMGKGWDHAVPGAEYWSAILGAAKPGAHLVAFGGTRQYHRLTCAIEDAGWEIRDCLMWLYGSGFPKSHDVSKAIDKAAGAEREVLGVRHRRTANEKYGNGNGTNTITLDTAPATDDAKRWDGWGTALKPAWEPIILARKPLAGTVAANVCEHGTGAINVDGCRIETSESDARAMERCNTPGSARFVRSSSDIYGEGIGKNPPQTKLDTRKGRWPANLILDEHAGAMVDEQSGILKAGVAVNRNREPGTNNSWMGTRASPVGDDVSYGDTGGASRFFYCPKASKADRDEGVSGVAGVAGVGALRDGNRESLPRKNIHPTVKPTELMRYLCRLVTPPGGTILDPFTGSGSTGVAANRDGFHFIGCELNEEYARIARDRIAAEDERAGLFATKSTPTLDTRQEHGII